MPKPTRFRKAAPSSSRTDSPGLRREQAEAVFSEGLALHRNGDLEGADAHYAEAIRLDPRHAGAHSHRGTIQIQLKRPDLAEAHIRASIAIDPKQPQALNNLGLVLSDLRRPDEAIEVLREAVRLQPDSPDLLANLGRALRRRKFSKEAVEVYKKAVALAPDRAGLHSGLGTALSTAELHDEAVGAHLKALELAPDRLDYRSNFAQALRAAKRDDEAESQYREILEIAPDDPHYRAALGRVLHEVGKYGEAVDVYRSARDLGAQSGSLEAALLFFQNHVLDARPEVLLDDARKWAERVSQGVVPYDSYPNSLDPERRLRIGLVSADFRGHPVGRFLDAPLREIDRDHFSLYGYSADDNGDPINVSLKKSIPNWRETKNVSDEDLVAQIRKDQIDILVDLSGHTAGARLRAFTFRPAPVSVTWLGYFATTGLDAIDYVLANRWLVPQEEEYQWAERPWHMPSAHWCFMRPQIEVNVGPSPALKNGYVTFGCYNNFDKLNPETIASWAEIMRRVPTCRMLLRSGNQKPGVKQRIVEAFAAAGFEQGERLTIDTTVMNYTTHMESYGLLDVALDPFPYNGGTTTVEALYMGVPVLTRHGDRFVAHMAESNVRSAGLDEWVGADTEDYIRRAVGFAQDIPALARLREGLRDQVLVSRLFDAKTFARDLEEAFRGMWRVWCEKQKQESSDTKSSGS